MNVFTVEIPDSAASLLVTYGAGALIRVQSSPTEGGAYGDITTIPIISGQSIYAVYDATGESTDWYKIRYEAADGDPAGAYSAAFQPMALDGIYASLSDLKNFVRDSGLDQGDDTLMLLALTASARAIDRACSRSFAVASDVATTRYFEPYKVPAGESYRYVVEIDDLADPTTITGVYFDTTGNGDYDGTAITAYRAGPLNAGALDKPYTRLIFDLGTYAPLHADSVKITAKWGWSATPSTIANANLMQAARFLKRRDAAFGIAGSAEMGSEMRLLAKVDPDVEVMLWSYKRVWGAA